MANAEYLKLLLETDKFYGGNNTVEQTIRLYEHDLFISCSGYNVMINENPESCDVEDYLEALDDFCEDRCVGWID